MTGDQTRSRHGAHYTVHFLVHIRLCGGRAAHFLLRSQYSEVCMCRPLRSWKVPSSVSDCSDGGLAWGSHSLAAPASCRCDGARPPPSQASTSHMKWTRPFHASCVQNARGRRVCRWLTYHTHLVVTSCLMAERPRSGPRPSDETPSDETSRAPSPPAVTARTLRSVSWSHPGVQRCT